MTSPTRAWLTLVAWLAGAFVFGGAPAPVEAAPPGVEVPPELAPWVSWVKERELPPGDCREVSDTTICAWPSYLSVQATESGASFQLDVSVFGPSQLEIPGDNEHWPQGVKVDKKAAVVSRVGGVPSLELNQGRHKITGTIPWRSLPDSVRVPDEMGLIDLRVGGEAVAFPSRTDGWLSLERPGDAPEVEPEPETPEEPEVVEPDSEKIEVSRQLVDGVPLSVLTRIDVHVTGAKRELVLPKPMWGDAKVLQISAPVPVKMGEDGSLVLQVRAGTFAVEVRGVLARAPSELAPPKRDAPWPEQEIWVWQAAQPDMPSMGQVSLSGAPAVDRARTHAPAGWAGGATYSVTAERPLKFEIIQRGVSQTAPNELQLNREMRVDMAGGAWTVQDSIYGTMNRGTRLDLVGGALAAATVNGVQQVVTVGETGNAGVEVRDATVSVNAQWRLEDSAATLPLGGWSEDFDRVRLEFTLPRGWDVLHATGPGSLKPTWFEAWRPLDLILLFVVVVLVGRFVHPVAAMAALFGLGFAYTRNGDGYLMLLGLVGTLTVLLVPLARVQHKWTRLGLRLLWASAAFVLGAWVVWRVPQGVTAVWRDGLSALAHVSLERDFEALAELWGMAAIFCGGTLALAWLGARAQKGMGRWVALGLATLVGLGGLATLFQRASDGGIAPTASAPKNEMNFEAVGERQAEFAAAPAMVEEEESEDSWDDGRAQGDEGKMGKASRNKSGLYAMKGPKDAIPAMAKSEDREDRKEESARSAGILGVMQDQDGYGVGGLGLVGTGRGGGGSGEGTIGLGNTGLIGKGGGGGTGSGYGTGGGGFGGKGKRVAIVRQAKATVQGSLDKDIIRRIVRAHINEVRSCYDKGLAKDENLGGRVEINFVITATGKVGASVVNNQTLKDRTVGNCIAKAVKRWKFPKPQGGGNVVVTYPFVLSPGDGPPPPPGNAPESERFVAKDLKLEDLPPPAVPQTGAGKPNWSGISWTFELDRAVKADEELKLWLVTPMVSKAIALLRALGLIWLAIALLRKGLLTRPEDESDDDEGPRAAKAVAATSKAAALVAGLLVWGAAASAQASPPKELLDELAQRVNEERPLAPSPDCGTQCVLVSKLGVDVRDDTLVIAAEVHMAGPGVWQLPGGVEVWIPKSVKVDGKAAAALAVHDDRLLLHLSKGLHRVELSGPVGADVLDLALPTQPKRVSASSEGWTVSGIDDNDLAQSLHLERLRPGSAAPADPALPEDPEDPPADPEGEGRTAQDQAPWFAVQRSIVVGPRWTVQTRVTRLSHGPSPTKVRVPLLPGEKMLEASAKVDDPKASLTFAAPGQSITWTSVLEQSSALELHAPEDKPWAETWVLTCAGAWQCGQAGTPATQDQGGTSVFNPWPGESLALSFFEPKPAAGELLAVDRAELNVELGETGTKATLSMTVRTATVAERVLELPPLAHVGAVRIDGTDVPVAKDSAQIRLSFQPGGHEVSVEFKLDAGSASVNHAPVVQLGGRAVNARVTFNFSDADERVVVWTSGDGVGPLVWLWPYLLVLVFLALVLSRFTSPPLNPLQWFVLSLGFSVMALPLVLGWFMLVQWRETKHAELDTALKYNAAQIGLGVITLGVLGLVLLTSKELLTSPMSTIVHNWGDGASLSWYLDRSEVATPAATIVTVPTSLWRAVWALWVVWLGWSTIGWAKWSWGIVGEGEWLRSAPAGGMSAQPEPDTPSAPAAASVPAPESLPEPAAEAAPPSPSFQAPAPSTAAPEEGDAPS